LGRLFDYVAVRLDRTRPIVEQPGPPGICAEFGTALQRLDDAMEKYDTAK